MKAVRWAWIVVLLLLALAVPLFAQFPAVVTLLWTPNPPEEQVQTYTVTFDGVVVQGLSASAVCTATDCRTPLTIPTSGAHVVGLTATNAWGTSEPAFYSFSASVPGKSTNIRITTK